MFLLDALNLLGIVQAMSFCRATCNPDSLSQATQKPFYLVPGDSPTLRFDVVRPDNSPFNLSDYAVDFYIKRSLQDTDVAAEFHGELGDGVELGAEVQDGLLDVTIPEGVTLELMLHRPYPWYLQLSHTISLEKIYIPARGTFLLALPAA